METAKQAAELFFACVGLGICVGTVIGVTWVTVRLCRKIF
jgi:flagellar biogenesis protein FliO